MKAHAQAQLNRYIEKLSWWFSLTHFLSFLFLEQGQNGFEELRRYVKQGSDFGKDLVAVLQER